MRPVPLYLAPTKRLLGPAHSTTSLKPLTAPLRQHRSSKRGSTNQSLRVQQTSTLRFSPVTHTQGVATGLADGNRAFGTWGSAPDPASGLAAHIDRTSRALGLRPAHTPLRTAPPCSTNKSSCLLTPTQL